MGILKVATVGESAILDIADAKEVKGNYGMQVCFTTIEGDHLYLSKDTAERQLDRLGLQVGDVIGERLKFYRTANEKSPGSPPYWNIERLEKGAARPVQTYSAKPASSAPSSGQTSGQTADRPELLETMYEITVTTLGTFIPLYRAAGLDLSQAVAEARHHAISLFIETCKSGRSLGHLVSPETQQIGQEFVRRAWRTVEPSTDVAVPNVNTPVHRAVQVPELLRDDPPKEMPTQGKPAWMSGVL